MLSVTILDSRNLGLLMMTPKKKTMRKYVKTLLLTFDDFEVSMYAYG